MRLNSPKKNVWFVALILAIVSIVLYVLPYVGVAAFFDFQGLLTYILMGVAYVLLLMGTTLKGF